MKLLTVAALLCAVMALTTAAACPKDWTPFNNNCYIYEPKSMTYAEAQKNCQSKGANLASAHSVEESKLLGKLVSEGFGGKSPYIWLGDSDKAKVHNSPVTSLVC
ncbi:type-2 ice-structuring protein-like [Parambassis ranga]|uniref:Type-2 ice-structuring protein-like n=1 Tax=Parambassis ranga TaxID=210632 RepID=A0A6P7I4M8_9TELE|nr:type-2 ice-structuring protein-like [Parambassis ranga]